MCRVWRLFTALVLLISCVTLEGSSPRLKHLFHVLRLRLFTALKVCILRAGLGSSSLSSGHLCTTLRDSFPHSRHLFCLSCLRARHWAPAIYMLGVFYMLHQELFTMLGHLCVVVRDFHHAQGIYFVCYARRLFTELEAYMCCVWGLFTMLETFILCVVLEALHHAWVFFLSS